MTTFTIYDRAGSGFRMDPNSPEGIDLTEDSNIEVNEVISDDGQTVVVSVLNGGVVQFMGMNYFLDGDFLFIEDLVYFNANLDPVLSIDDINWELSFFDFQAGNYQSAQVTSLPDVFWGNNYADVIYSGLSADRIYGKGGDDRLYGGTGDDSVFGGLGNDRLFGEAGSDNLHGDDGNDKLTGSSGRDVLTGGRGKDVLAGGADADRFDFNSKGECGIGGTRDIIRDLFVGDLIDLSGLDANERVSGNQAFTFVGNRSFSRAGELSFNARTGILAGNTDADRAPEFEIEVSLVGGNRLDALDLIL